MALMLHVLKVSQVLSSFKLLFPPWLGGQQFMKTRGALIPSQNDDDEDDDDNYDDCLVR